MLKGRSLLEYTNLFSPTDYEKNDKMILKYFQQLKGWQNCIVLFVVNIENLKNLKYHTFSKVSEDTIMLEGINKLKNY